MEEINGVNVEDFEDIYADYGDGADVVYRVSETAKRWLGRFTGYRAHQVLRAINDPIERADWEAVGILALAGGDPWQADREVAHHGNPRYGNAHLCELARAEAEQERVSDVLHEAAQQDSPNGTAFSRHEVRSTWLISDGVLFYDIGAARTAAAVAELETALSESALHDEMRAAELERQEAEEGFLLPSVAYGSPEPDRFAVFEVYARMNGTLCPECGIDVGMTDAMRKYYGDDLVECFDCEEFVIHDGIGTRPACCQLCAQERADASVELERATNGRLASVDLSTGNDLIVRWNNGETYRWDTVQAEWRHWPGAWQEAVNR